MAKQKRAHLKERLKEHRRFLQEAQASNMVEHICVARTDLGLTLFQLKKYAEGLEEFDAAAELAATTDDADLRRLVLSRKMLALQEAERLPDAYKVALEIVQLAETHDDAGMKCDALLSQGQILLDSGEPIIAVERFQEARELALALNDTRREMNVTGTMGQLALATGSVDQAQAYFDKALRLARQLGNREAEAGFLGNRALIVGWLGDHREAARDYEQVLAYLQEMGDEASIIQALRHLVQEYGELGQHERVIEYARQGIALTENDPGDELFTFYEALILALYQAQQPVQAEAATEEAIALARGSGDRKRQVDFLVSLGESYLLSGMPEKAIAAYEKARAGAVRLSRRWDEAYLTGRIGVALAEAGRLPEALEYHERAVALAREREIPELEGEQLSMLALAHLDSARRNGADGDGSGLMQAEHVQRAREHARASLALYSEAGIEDGAARARRLLEEIGSLVPQ
ncbi:MAG TPA: tetratricopeptide repeat protein [Candidatus Sulfomarinibacteraceae bacterium]|nr:tetratricopeptide repeat protein [Candidatus Sulfomarinibacteraceae bacterium]